MNNIFCKYRFISNLCRSAVAVIVMAGALACSADVITWTNSASGSFGNPANWSPNQVPADNDTAIITTNGITVSLDATRTVGSIILGDNLNCGAGGPIFSINGQLLNLNGTFQINTCGQFTLDSGRLHGNTTNTLISGSLGWSAGQMDGTLTLTANSTLAIVNSNNHDLQNCTFTNLGTILWNGGTLRFGGCPNTTFYNYGLWDCQGDFVINNAFGCSASAFNNLGTFRKSIGSPSNSTVFQGSVVFNNSGTVDVRAGILYLAAGGSFTGGTATNTGGLIQLAANGFNINGTVTSTNVQQVGGDLVGNNVISGGFTWINGLWNNNAVTITSNSLVKIVGSGVNDMSSMNLTNYGTIAWSSGTIRAGGCNGGTGIYNFGLWDSQADLVLNDAYGCNGTTFNNFGTLRKSAGSISNSTQIQGGVFLANTGIIDVQTGNLSLQGGGSFTGGTATNPGGIIQLAAGNFNINGTVTSANVQQVGANLTGVNQLAGSYTWISGIWNNSTVTIAPNCLVDIMGGGGVNDMATATLTNYGTIAWSSGVIRSGGCGGGTPIYNYGVWDSQGDLTWNDAYGCNGTTLNNFGTLRKSLGSATNSTQIQNGIFINNNGVIDVQAGNLSLQGGGNFTGGTATNQAGMIQLVGSSYTINGTLTSTNVQQVGANLVGNNILTGGFTWISGVWNSSAVTIGTNTLLDIAGGGGLNDMFTALVTNYGTVAWSSGTIRSGGCGGGTLVVNYGLWDSQGDLVWNDAQGCNNAIINNYGTFRKSVGSVTNTTLITGGVTFNNAGVVDVRSGNLSLQGGGNFTAGAITNNVGIVQLAGGGFTINGTVTAANVQLLGGNLVGANVLAGTFTWISGTWNNAAVTIATNALVNIMGAAGNNDFVQAAITNYGTVAWSSGTLRGGGCNSAFIYNYGLWDVQADLIMNDLAGGCNPTFFNNYGVLRKSAGSVTSSTQIQPAVIINNQGNVDVQAGNLSLQGGGSFTGGVATNNVGTVQLTAGNYTINGTRTSANFEQSGGNLTGNNLLAGGYTWISGVWNNAGVTVATNSQVNIAGGAGVNDFAQASITNFGTVAWSSGALRGGGCNNAFIYNYGVWDLQGDLTMNDAAGGCNPTFFNNFGVLRKSEGFGTGLFDAAIIVTNSGTLAALSGLLQFNSTPSFASGNLIFGIGGSTNFGQILAPGTVSLGGGVSAVLLNGYTPSVGVQFQVLTYGGTNGTFTDFTGLNAGSGVAFTPSLTATGLTLTAVATNFTSVGPTIIAQPAAQTTVNYGSTVTFQVGVSGSPTLVYQWSHNNVPIPGATSATLTLTNVLFTDAGIYNVAVSNSVNHLVSQPAQLTVNPVLPSITGQPQNVTIPQGSNAVFTVTVAGEPPPSLQWSYNGNKLTDGGRISGSMTTTLTISNVQPFDAGNYVLTATNGFGVAISSTAVLKVNFPDLAVASITPPTNAVIGQFVPVVFTITNIANGIANGPWLNQILLSTNANGTNAIVLGTAQFSGTINAFGTAVVTQNVILPANMLGLLYFGVTVNSAISIPEVTTANNTSFTTNATLVQGADLALTQFTAPPSGQFGQTLTVGFAVTNLGTAPTTATWNDKVYFNTVSNSLSGATLLTTVPGPASLAVGAGYTRTQNVTLPLTSTSGAGTFYLIAVVDADNSQLETTETNNQLTDAILLAVPPLPDLVVGQVGSATNGLGGQIVPVSWTVTNIGPFQANGPWSESVYLAPATLTLAQFTSNSAAYPRLAVFTYTNNLAPGATVARSELVTIPSTSLAGDLRAVILVDINNNVVEQNETNNAALATNDLQVPLALALSVPISSIGENTSSPNIFSMVSRNGDLTSALIVSLASSGATHLQVPATVTIPAGAGSALFTAHVLDDLLPGPDAQVTITATATNYQNATAQVLVANTDVPTLTVSVATSPILQGDNVRVTVGRFAANSQPVSVAITASSITALGFPNSVTIPANSNSVSFLVSAVQNTFITPAQIYTINASATGYLGGSAGLTVLNDNAPTLTLALDRTNISEADGPLAVTATVSRQPATDQPVTIALANNNTGAAKVPAQVVIPSLQGSVTFSIAAVNDPTVTGPKNALISAQTLDTGGNLVGIAAQQLLTVQDANGPSLKVSIATKVVSKGLNPASSATVSTTTPPTNNLVVSLTSSATNEATVPATVTLLAGQSNVTFNIASVDDGLSDTNVTASITASATNYASGSAVISVTDLGTSDLTIASITAPGTAFTDQPLTVGFRLSNQGLGALVSGCSQSVFLLTDPTSDNNKVLLGTVPFPGPLLAGQFVDQSLVVQGSSLPAPGTYYLEVVADVNNEVAELNEANNTLISSTPIVVQPEYTATVTAGSTNSLAGNPVSLTGSATLIVGGPAANRPVNILITLRGLQRVISATTDASGNFAATFTPLPGEAGIYTAAAVAPGVTSAPAQTQFNILGFSLNPSSLVLYAIEGSNATAIVTLQNLGEVPLTGLTATANGLAANFSASNTFSSTTLAGQGTVTLSCVITANSATTSQSSFAIHIASAEGAFKDMPVLVTVIPLQPRLAITPSTLTASMLRGSQTVVTLNVINVGGAPTGPVTVNLPNAPWLAVGSMNPMPSIAPGATNTVSFILTPTATMALGPYTGTLQLNGNATGIQVPFTFTAVSDAHGALLVQSVDEYTYFASNSPPLTNASVTLLNPFTSAIVAQGVTDTNGVLLLTNLMEGVYELDLTAGQHAPFRGEAVVSAGVTNNILAFLSRQTVTYVWTVVPTTVQDSNEIVITTTFEANVPAPVVVPTPASIDLAPLQQPGQTLDIPLTLVNQGLIAVSNVTLGIPTHPLYRFDLATTQVGSLAAHGTITIPIRVTRLAAPPGQSALKPLGFGPCGIPFAITFDFPCGPFQIFDGLNIQIQHVDGNCASTPGSSSVSVGCNICGVADGGSGYSSIPSNPGRGSIGFQIPPQIALPPSCDPCLEQELDCLIGFVPGLGCLYSLVKSCGGDIYNGVAGSKTVEDCGFALLGCVGGTLGNIAGCAQGLINCKCNSGSISQCVSNAISGGGGSIKSLHPLDGTGGGLNSGDLRDVYLARTYVGVEFLALVVGDTNGEWFTPGSGPEFSAFFNAFTDAAQPTSTQGPLISPDEAAILMALPAPPMVTPAEVISTINRWNLTVSNWHSGIFTPADAPPGASTNFIDINVYTNLFGQWGDQLEASQLAGFNTPVDGLIFALQHGGKQAGATCALIKLEIDQSAVLTRDAFHATLELNNGGVSPLSNITVNINFKNQAGQDVTSLFGVEPSMVSGGLTAVDGSGVLPAGSSGTAQWTLLPSIDAAPQAPTNYLVSGTFSYVQAGVTITIPLSPAPIAVQPSPQLYLNYFLQRDVFADDPFTPEIEPSIPFPLAVMVQNKGYGVAQNFSITTAQPKIIDNEKGLLINFTIIGTQVSGQPQTPSLTADFGDINPMSTKVADFLLTSTLQGLFIDYQATFTHIDPLGNPRLSLIQDVTIHEMTHMVQADGAFDDGLPDFLTTENPNFESLPDTLFLSDGSTQPVSVLQTATVDAPADTNHLTVQLTANCPAGFSYILVPDPANGKLGLLGIQRANGTNLLAPNFYLTDRTFTGLGQTPIRENKLHLFDYHTNAGPVTYTLVYAAPSNLPDTNAPISSVYSLQPQSPPIFGVAWNGADFVGESGLAFFDIYSSDNGGAFTNWQSHTVATGATFDGTPGHMYSFYSIATDNAGNREATPTVPQAQTVVNLTNFAPTISVTPLVNLNAGQTLSLGVTASDMNVFDNLTFSLAPGAPAGVQVNPNTGQITWATSLAQGGTTNSISVIVTDNGQPPLSAMATVKVVLVTVADPPVLAAIPNFTITDGTLLKFTNSATDDTMPARTLAYSLNAGAPTGATVDPVSGIFQWRPMAQQAPSTNNISVIVSDNGTPSLSATQQFQVIVRSASSEFLLSVGSTNVLAGNSAFVPVRLQGSLPLTNITAILQGSASLTNFTLQAVSPEVLSTLVQALGSNQYSVNVALNPALSPSDTRTLVQLNFAAAPQVHSAIVPLNFSQLTGVETDGSTAPKPGTGAGQVFLVAREALLNAWMGSSGRMLAVFGKPWASYEVDYSTNYGASWKEMMRVPLTNSFFTVGVTNSFPQVFYRALEFSADPPLVELHTPTPSNLTVLVYGQAGSYYLLLSQTNLANTNWSQVAGFSLTNSFQYISTGAPTNAAEFFRVKKQ